MRNTKMFHTAPGRNHGNLKYKSLKTTLHAMEPMGYLI